MPICSLFVPWMFRCWLHYRTQCCKSACKSVSYLWQRISKQTTRYHYKIQVKLSLKHKICYLDFCIIGKVSIILCGFNFKPKTDSQEDKDAEIRARQFTVLLIYYRQIFYFILLFWSFNVLCTTTATAKDTGKWKENKLMKKGECDKQ